jgi:replicative DNA helicase
MTAPDRLAPANLEAEEAVLGSMLIDGAAIIRVAAQLAPDDFYRPAHTAVYVAMLELYGRRDAIDVVTVAAELERTSQLDAAGGAAYLTELIERTPVSTHVEYYAGLVARTATQRRLIAAAGQIAQVAYEDEAETIEETVDRAEAALFAVLQDRQHRDLVPLSVLLDRYFEKIEEIRARQDAMLGTRTGFRDLDRLLGGLQPSDLCIVAGRPGMGKTSWLNSVAANVAEGMQGTVAFFSLEMSAEQLVQRLIASKTGISTHHLRVGQIRDDEIDLVMRAIGELASAAIYIDDTPGLSPFDLRTKVRRLHAERGVDLVIVDYLQLMHSGRRNENRVQEISLISRALKGLAREVRVPVIAASQLSRAVESRADRRPQLSDLRESGCLTGDTQLVRADTGEIVSIEDLAAGDARNVPIWSLDPTSMRVVRRTLTRAFSSGTKSVFRLVLRSGREIKASANHPFLTVDGWRAVEDLAAGTHVAVARTIPDPEQPSPMTSVPLVLPTTLTSVVDTPSTARRDFALSLAGDILRAGTVLKSHELVCLGGAGANELTAARIGRSTSPKSTPAKAGAQPPTPYDPWATGPSPEISGFAPSCPHRSAWASPRVDGRNSCRLGPGLRRGGRSRGRSLASTKLRRTRLGKSDVYWDEITAIEPLGEQPVFDATVPGTHNFLANGIVAHNSIEQDADMVIFLYRDAVYNEHTEKKNIAEIHVAKHRHGPTGTVNMVFVPHETRFVDLADAQAAEVAATTPEGWPA